MPVVTGNVEILHRAQMGQDVYIYTEYARTKHIYIYIYIYIHIYIHIDNFPFSPQVWGSLRSPQLYVTGPTWRRSTCENDRARAEWGMSSPSMIVLESEDGNKETLHRKRVRQRRKI